MRDTTRAFVGLEPPRELRDGIVSWLGAEAGDPALRPVAGPNLHMTLAFLGEIGEAKLQRAAEIVLATRPRAVGFRLRPEPVGVPRRGRSPGLYALEADSEAAVELAAGLEAELGRAGVYRPPSRPFWPHLTAARVRKAPGGRGPRLVRAPPGSLPEALCERMFAVRITLYRSEIKSEGAQYTPLAQVELPGETSPGGGEEADG